MSSENVSQCQIVNYICDDLNRVLSRFILNPIDSDEFYKHEENESNKFDCERKYAVVIKADGYFLSVFTNLLKSSNKYSELVFRNFLKCFNTRNRSEIVIKFQLVKPKVEIIDYGWNDRIGYMICERRELENSMSWLSTLGGGFSALGDSKETCAIVAGKISIQQFRIAFRLGEPTLVARCKLYMALSLIQLGKLPIAKKIITEQYVLAKSFDDTKLQNMCKGIWAKLQYVRHLQKNTSKKK